MAKWTDVPADPHRDATEPACPLAGRTRRRAPGSRPSRPRRQPGADRHGGRPDPGRSLADAGGKGLFIKELEQALRAGQAEIAVHSMKDMPSELPPGFAIGAALERGDPRDAFVSPRHESLAALPRGARVGTSSQRRQCQLRHARPDIEIVVLRGNVETRLRKLDAGECDATILAAAGLERLGLEARIRAHLTTAGNAAGCRSGRHRNRMRRRTRTGYSPCSARSNTPRRARCSMPNARFAARLGGSCQSPIAAQATLAARLAATARARRLAGRPDDLRRRHLGPGVRCSGARHRAREPSPRNRRRGRS